jgi:hypothetical protein
MRRRRFLRLTTGSLALAAAAPGAALAGSPTPITVHKSPSCGCCAKWADYLAFNGFAVTIVDEDRLDATKARHGVPPALHSCHTALVDGYVIEGHVPVNDIRRLLAERPAITGLSAPGMPALSPGMNSIEPKGYDVIAFAVDGRTGLYSRY